ncbi:MAG: LytTR family transcriptional regulator DNA-binding domain-containing protein [Prevotellaceae bacterium]|jgi:DNA-binding LytR/AlgR family response regulator|nr:LytTR family transcriptional regulator DNA-binding domain-containing protein [Prevotellaceae bacterium]
MDKINLHVVFDRTELGIKVKNSWKFYPYETIIEIRADSHYSEVTISNIKVPLCADIPLKIFAENLPLIFFKYSRSGIINLGYMQSYSSKSKTIEIKMTTETCHTVSRYLKDSFDYRVAILNRKSLPCEKCKTCTKRGTCGDMTPYMIQKTD